MFTIANRRWHTRLVHLPHIAYQRQNIAYCSSLLHLTHQPFQLLAVLHPASSSQSAYQAVAGLAPSAGARVPVAGHCICIIAPASCLHHCPCQLLAIACIIAPASCWPLLASMPLPVIAFGSSSQLPIAFTSSQLLLQLHHHSASCWSLHNHPASCWPHCH